RPCRYWLGPNVFSLPDQVGNDPMFLPDLKSCLLSPRSSARRKSTAVQQGQDGPVALAPNRLCRQALQQYLGLFDGLPIADPHAKALSTLYAANAGERRPSAR